MLEKVSVKIKRRKKEKEIEKGVDAPPLFLLDFGIEWDLADHLLPAHHQLGSPWG